MATKRFVCLCLISAWVIQTNAQGLISNFQDFALFNNPMNTGTPQTDQGMPNDSAFPPDTFPPDSAIPPDNSFPADNAFPPDNAFPADNAFPPSNAFPPDGTIGLPSSQPEVAPGPDTQTESDRGTVITLEPIRNDHFLPSIPPGGQFVNLISGITNNFEPQPDWLSNNQGGATGETTDQGVPLTDPPTTGGVAGPLPDPGVDITGSHLGTSMIDKPQIGLPVTPGEMQPLVPGPGLDTVVPGATGGMPVDLGKLGHDFSVDGTPVTGSQADLVPTGTENAPGQSTGFDPTPSNVDDPGLDPTGIINPLPGDPGFSTTGSIDPGPRDPMFPALGAGQEPGGVALGGAIPLDTVNTPTGAIGSPGSTSLVPVDLLPGTPTDFSADPLAVTMVDTSAQDPAIQPLESTGGASDQLQMPDTYNLMARASIHNFSKNRDLTRRLRNIRRKARKEWKEKQRQRGRGGQKGNSESRKGPRGAQIARMVLPGRRQTVVGKNTRGRVGRGNSAPCTRRRQLLGLCSTERSRLKRSATNTGRDDLSLRSLNKLRSKRQIVFQTPRVLGGGSGGLMGQGKLPLGTLQTGNIGGMLSNMASRLFGNGQLAANPLITGNQRQVVNNPGGQGLLGVLQQRIRSIGQQRLPGAHRHSATVQESSPDRIIGPKVLETGVQEGAINTNQQSLLDMLPEDGMVNKNTSKGNKGKGNKVKKQNKKSNKGNKKTGMKQGGNNNKGWGKMNVNQGRRQGKGKKAEGKGGRGRGKWKQNNGGFLGGSAAVGGRGVGGRAGGPRQRGKGRVSGPEGGRLLGAQAELTDVDPTLTKATETHATGAGHGGGMRVDQKNRQVKVRPPKEKGVAELTPVNLASLNLNPNQKPTGDNQNVLTGSGVNVGTSGASTHESGNMHSHVDPSHGSEPRRTETISGFGTIEWGHADPATFP